MTPTSPRARFLEALFGRIPGGYIEMRSFAPRGGSVYTPKPTFIAQPDLKAAHWSVDTSGVEAQGLDPFVGVATRKDASGGGRDNCAWVPALFIDVDFKNGEEACREAVYDFPLTPSIIVESGAGMHVYWLLKNPISATAQETAVALARIASAFCEVADSVSSEPARVLRLPDTLNRKYNPPLPVKLAACNPELRYSLGEILEHCPEVELDYQEPGPFEPVAPVGIPVNHSAVKNMPEEFANRNLYIRDAGKGKHYVICPWAHEHTSASVESATAIFHPRAGGRSDLWGFECRHDHCKDRTIGDVYEIWFGKRPDDNLPTSDDEKPDVDPKTWRTLFHTHDDFLRAKPLDFAIDGFLQEDGITYLGGLPGHGKTLIMLSIVQALLTGDKLFDHFVVKRRAERILYLIPEAGISAFKQRLELFRLLPFVKEEKLFVRTLSIGEEIELTDKRILEAAKGADVFLDTAVRFMEGDENSSEHHREFAKTLFNLQKAGAKTIVGAHHAPKTAGGGGTPSLEGMLRGSGDVGAMVATCWAVQQTEAETNVVTVSNIKARDFMEAPTRPFEITGRPHLNDTGKFRLSGMPGLVQVIPKSRVDMAKVGQARHLLAAGLPMTKIAEMLDVTAKTIGNWKKDGLLEDSPVHPEVGF